jgi:hypothetical protein
MKARYASWRAAGNLGGPLRIDRCWIYAIAKVEGGVYLRLSPDQYARLRRPEYSGAEAHPHTGHRAPAESPGEAHGSATARQAGWYGDGWKWSKTTRGRRSATWRSVGGRCGRQRCLVLPRGTRCLLKNDRTLSSDQKQRLAVFNVIPPGFDRPVTRKFGQAIFPVNILAENPKEPIGLLVRYSRTKAGENLRIWKVSQRGHLRQLCIRYRKMTSKIASYVAQKTTSSLARQAGWSSLRWKWSKTTCGRAQINYLLWSAR